MIESGKGHLSTKARTVALLLMSVTMVACSTTAFIALQQSRITRIVPLGTTGAVCDGVTADSASLLRIALTNQRNETVLQNSPITVGSGVRPLDLESVRDGVSLVQPRYFVEPEIRCTSDAECVDAGYDGFECKALSPADEASQSAQRACAFVPELQSIPLSDRGIGDDIPSIKQVDERNRPKLVLTLFANGTTIQGQSACLIATGNNPACFPDSRNLRAAAFRELRERVPASEAVARSHRLCAGAFSISQGLEEIRYVNNNINDCFEPVPESRQEASNEQEPYNSDVRQLLSGQFPQGSRNVWGAAYDALEQMLREATGQLRSRLNVSDVHLVLFTDGPDESLRVPGDALRDRSPEAVAALIEEMEERYGNEVRVHIVQFDPQEQLVGNDGTVFWSPYGPIDEFAQFSCKTGGQYHYVTTIESLSESYATLALQMNAYLQGVVRWPGLNDLPESGYLVSGVLAYDIFSSTGNAQLGGRIEGQVGAQTRVDNRVTFFARGGRTVDPAPVDPDEDPNGEEPVDEEPVDEDPDPDESDPDESDPDDSDPDDSDPDE